MIISNDAADNVTNTTKSIAEIVYGPDVDKEQAALLLRRR